MQQYLLALIVVCTWSSYTLCAEEPVKKLILPGESFLLKEKPAFILWPEESKRKNPQPWIMYAPTLPAYPDQHEKWMHEQFLKAGVAIAGIDVGEAFGSPDSQQYLDALYTELTTNRGFAKKVALLGRSRGGLWVSSWASRNVEHVASISGIYPVFDLRTYPGLKRAAPAYQLTMEQLETEINLHNPINKVDKLAEAGIPTYLIHGDQDKVVPLKENSQEYYQRYEQAKNADKVNLAVIQGQGHNFWPGFFHSQQLVDFTIEHAYSGAGISRRNTPVKLPPSVISFTDVVYAEPAGRPHLMDIYMPKQPHGPIPAIIWIHGGAWSGGNKDRCPATWLVDQGYAVISVNYRLISEGIWPAQIDDCREAIRYIRGHAAEYCIDGNRIGVWGASAGGHLVAELGTQDPPKDEKVSSRVQAVCDWFGPTDLIAILSKLPEEEQNKSVVTRLLGTKPKDNTTLAESASPFFHVTSDDPPFLIMHGDQDKLVPLDQSQKLHDKLLEVKVPCTLKVYKDTGHGGEVFLNQDSRKLILEFFNKHLQQAP